MCSDLNGSEKYVRPWVFAVVLFGRASVYVWCDCRRCFVRVGRGEETCHTGQRKVID